MRDHHKQVAAERYEQELRKGERFWPDSIYKDLLVSLGIFVLLVLLATFVGIEPQPKADPNNSHQSFHAGSASTFAEQLQVLAE